MRGTRFQAVWADGVKVLALQADGLLLAWGGESALYLGTGQPLEKNNKPAPVMAGVRTVHLWEHTTLALGEDGTAWMWGYLPDWVPSGDGKKPGSWHSATPVQLFQGVKDVGRLSFNFNNSYLAYVRQDDSSLWVVQQQGDTGTKIMDRVQTLCLPLVIDQDGSLWQLWKNVRNEVIAEKLGEGITSACMDSKERVLALRTDGTLVGWGKDMEYLFDGKSDQMVAWEKASAEEANATQVGNVAKAILIALPLLAAAWIWLRYALQTKRLPDYQRMPDYYRCALIKQLIYCADAAFAVLCILFVFHMADGGVSFLGDGSATRTTTYINGIRVGSSTRMNGSAVFSRESDIFIMLGLLFGFTALAVGTIIAKVNLDKRQKQAYQASTALAESKEKK